MRWPAAASRAATRAVVLPAVGFVRRIAVEERALSTQLGGSYRRYAATHRRLVPGLW